MPREKPLPGSYFFISLILIVGLHFVFPVEQIINWPWRWLGILPIALGSWLNLWGDQLFKKYKTEVKPFRKSTTLVTHGPFCFSRNPLYVGMILILLGAGILCGSIITLLPVVCFTLCMRMVFIPVEERMMLEIFGDKYRRYCQKVRRWI